MEATSTDQTTAAVFAGGTMSAGVAVAPSSFVIAADSGYDNARSMGVTVDILVGDMDSISAAGLAEAEELGVIIERFPSDKDATDLELAIDTALRRGANHVTIYAGEAGSFGHLLGVALGLTDKRWAEVSVVWRIGGASVYRSLPSFPVRLHSEIGSIVTILPIGDTTGVTASGLRWPLDNSDLERGTTLGLSNVSTSPVISISVQTGALLIIVEEADAQ
ncbi:MAG: thiamine diphosphokinase [Actinomycetia bacterium]|nr:thiamine diphosphokinase [Actinomycetes bacterium]